MMLTQSSAAVFAVIVFVLQPATPQRLNIKPGAWQFDIKVDIAGVPPKQVKQNTCVRQEDLNKPVIPPGATNGGSCTQTTIKATATEQQVRVDCNGPQKSSTNVHLIAPDPTNMSGDVDGTVAFNGGTMHTKATFTAQFLNDNCSAVKMGPVR